MSIYFRLMRLHQPTGIWLLLFPCWWALALASGGSPSWRLLILFGFGAVVMRGAGCVINDMADRKLDAKVARTKTRPLASGEISMKNAAIFLCILLVLGFFIAWLIGPQALLWAALSLVPVGIYPWMKRISWWPQLFLGLSFNWGALMAWAVVRGQLQWPALLLYAGGILWTLGYDTIYAYQDRKDDTKIGIRSSARRLGDHPKPVLLLFYAGALLCWAIAATLVGANAYCYALLSLGGLQFFWQLMRLNLQQPDSCRAIFKSNLVLGSIIFAAFLANSF